MGWFGRRPRFRFPSDMPRRLEVLGRHTLDPRTGGADASEVWSYCLAPFMADSRAAPEEFLAALGVLSESDDSGFEVLGATALVWESFGGDALEIPAALPIIDAGIDAKLSRGLPTARLTGYEAQRLNDRRRG